MSWKTKIGPTLDKIEELAGRLAFIPLTLTILFGWYKYYNLAFHSAIATLVLWSIYFEKHPKVKE